MSRKPVTKAEIDSVAQEWVEREILACDTALVELLAGGEGDAFGIEAWENSSVPVSSTCLHCDADLVYESGEWQDQAGRASCPAREDEDHEPYDRDTEYETQEVFEWWRVTRYAYDSLREAGEVVIDNDYGYWWGRGTTGQAIYLDHVIREIAKDLWWYEDPAPDHASVLRQVADILWPGGDPDHEWSPDTLDDIALLLERNGLRPTDKSGE